MVVLPKQNCFVPEKGHRVQRQWFLDGEGWKQMQCRLGAPPPPSSAHMHIQTQETFLAVKQRERAARSLNKPHTPAVVVVSLLLIKPTAANIVINISCFWELHEGVGVPKDCTVTYIFIRGRGLLKKGSRITQTV